LGGEEKKGDEDEVCVFQRVCYKWFRRTKDITELGLDYKEVGGIGS
jgi:hypothetical protein